MPHQLNLSISVLEGSVLNAANVATTTVRITTKSTTILSVGVDICADAELRLDIVAELSAAG